jgi:outer membrane protein OmpA-like peptidoglycan-associated protein
MKNQIIFCAVIFVCLTLSAQAVAQDTDCALADRYYGLAQDRLGTSDNAEASVFLERAGSACPRFNYFQELGELRMMSVNEDDRRLAVDAFVEAHALAAGDAERSRALWKYAELLNDEGDPQNADPLIREARRLGPDNQEIAELASRIQAQIENPTEEQLVRGLADSLYKPLRWANTGNDDKSESPPLAARMDGPSIRLQINFEFNSTAVDTITAENVATLARSLMDESLTGREFEFVGHADVRGDEMRNMELSRQRADAIYTTVTDLEPGLEGRIITSGRGETEPIESGNTEEAHWANRRLQVLVK